MKLRLLFTVTAILGIALSGFAQSEFEDKIGRQTFEMMAKTQGFYENEALLSFVVYVGKRLEAQMEENEYDFKYYLVDVQEPNAFATAGGYVYVTRGLLSIIDTEDELACVLGHEFTHVLHKHSNKKIGREVLPTVLEIPGNLVGTFMAENLGALLNLPIEVASKSINSIFDRHQENDADENGVKLAAKAGYDPKALETALNKLQLYVEIEGSGSERFSIFDNHPLTSHRVENIEKVLAGMTYEPKKQLHILGRTEGIVLGDNPKSGLVVKGNKFLHPDMNLSLQLPKNWDVQNTPAALTTISKGKNSGLVMGLDSKHSNTQEAAKATMKELEGKKVDIDYTETFDINGFSASKLEVESGRGGPKSIAVWVNLGEESGLLQFSGTSKKSSGYVEIVEAIQSLKTISTDEEKLVTETVLRFEIAPDMTLGEYAKSKGANDAMLKWLELLNGLKDGDKLNDQYVKYAEIQSYPVQR